MLAGERMVKLTGGGGGKAAILQGLAGEAKVKSYGVVYGC